MTEERHPQGQGQSKPPKVTHEVVNSNGDVIGEFSNEGDAEDWTDEHPDGDTLTIRKAETK